jgi:hypothetical protein
VGDDTLFPDALPYIVDEGRARRDGDLPPGGRGDDEREGRPEPVYFFWDNVKEKMACEREDWAFMSVSLVLRIDVPLRIKLS